MFSPLRGTSYSNIVKNYRPQSSERGGSCRSPGIPESLGTTTEDPKDSRTPTPGQASVSKPSGMLQECVDRYKQGDTHPVSALYQLSQILQFHLEMKETVSVGNTTGLYFAFCAVIDGMEYKTGMGKTKKEAKHSAAELALKDYLPTLEGDPVLPERSDGPPPLPVQKNGSFCKDILSSRAIQDHKNPVNDQILQAVTEHLNKLTTSYPEFSDCQASTAAFIIQTPSGCEVVAVGTGNCNTRESAAPNGRVLHDSHAVVAARRSLMRYLYRHLLLYFSKTGTLKEKSVFQHIDCSPLLSLKSSISLHLYLNQLPKGAAQIPSSLRLNPFSMSAWEMNNQISLHLTMEGKVFSVFSSALEQSGTKVVSMSATDKITQWQVLGYQGALISHFIEPVYAQTILVGDTGGDVRGVEVAVSQRVDGVTTRLPMHYCMLRPHISLVPAALPGQGAAFRAKLSLNWSQGDSSVEAVDSLAGRTAQESPFKSGPGLASRLCKAAMLSRFNLVAKEAQRQDLLAVVSYRKAKMMAKPYQEAKNMLKSFLSQQGYGSWLAKPPVSDHFSM